ncbi:hypothetical protein [Lampropedia hyalina]|jgi:hypothetical protein|uniref:hypothetical protein n=1 Tax=Lampropedia hyalina TaxID=198706 RepID=UPI0011610BF9|nr:hypothetical protein [Lampropedia hyalina]
MTVSFPLKVRDACALPNHRIWAGRAGILAGFLNRRKVSAGPMARIHPNANGHSLELLSLERILHNGIFHRCQCVQQAVFFMDFKQLHGRNGILSIIFHRNPR